MLDIDLYNEITLGFMKLALAIVLLYTVIVYLIKKLLSVITF